MNRENRCINSENRGMNGEDRYAHVDWFFRPTSHPWLTCVIAIAFNHALSQTTTIQCSNTDRHADTEWVLGQGLNKDGQFCSLIFAEGGREMCQTHPFACIGFILSGYAFFTVCTLCYIFKQQAKHGEYPGCGDDSDAIKAVIWPIVFVIWVIIDALVLISDIALCVEAVCVRVWTIIDSKLPKCSSCGQTLQPQAWTHMQQCKKCWIKEKPKAQ